MHRRFSILFLLLFLSGFCYSQGLRSTNSLEYSNPLPNREVLVSEHFEIYYEPKAYELAKYVLDISLESTAPIELALGYRLSGKVEIQLFHDPETALYTASSLISDQYAQNTGGITFLELGSIHLYFKGDKETLRKDIRRGISRILIHEMLYGGTIQESIRYTAMLHLPQWFTEGLSNYLSGPWTVSDDDRLRTLIQTGKKIQIDDLSEEDQALVGKSIWNYIAALKGENSFQRMLYLIRLTKKLENSVYFIFSWNVRELLQNWYEFSIGTYTREVKRKMPREPEKKPIEEGTILNVIQSNQNYYLLSTKGNYFFLHQRQFNSQIFSEIHKIYRHQNEYKFRGIPMMSDDGKGGCFLLFYENNSYKLIHLPDEGKIQEIMISTGLNVVREIDFLPAQETLYLLGIRGTRNALELLKVRTLESGFLFQTEGEVKDLSIHKGGKELLFSFREGESGSNWDIFNWAVESEEFPGNKLVFSETSDETDPQYVGSGYVAFLSDINGIQNSYITMPGSKNWNAMTDYPYSITKAKYDTEQNTVSELVRLGRENWWFVSDLDTQLMRLPQHRIPQLTYFREKPPVYGIEEYITVEPDSALQDTSAKVYFQTGFPDLGNEYYSSKKEPEKVPAPFVLRNVSFLKPEILITQLDNGWFNTYYVPTFIQLKEVLNNPIGLVCAIKLSEISQKYTIIGGGKISRNFNQYDYFININKSVGSKIIKTDYFRQTRRIFSSESGYGKIFSDQLKIAWVERPYRLMQWSVGFQIRADRYNSLSEDRESLKKTGVSIFRMGPEAVWVVNTSKRFKEGLYRGWKSKVYLNANWGNTRNANLIIWGLDTRYGIRINKHLYAMQRLQYEASAGQSKVQYILGAQEGWLFPDQNVAEPLLIQNGYYRMASSFRGSGYNIRNGNSFICYNMELRYRPLGQLFKMNSRPNWIENLLFVGFFDLGSAWYGNSPFSLRSPLNYTQIQSGTMQITLYNRRQPFVFGTGFGFRTSMVGYYFKFDRGYGRINSVWKEGMNYVTVGKDF